MVTSASTTDDSRTLAQTTVRSPMLVSKTWLPVRMMGVTPDGGLAAQHDAGLDGHVLGDPDAGVDERAGRIDDGHPGAHVPLVDAQPQLQLGIGQLGPVVDAEERAVVVDLEGRHGPVVGTREGDQLGQVELAGDRRGPHVADAPAQPVDVEGVEAGVDLVEGQLVGRGVPDLDDAPDASVGAAHDPPEGGRLVDVDAHERHRGLVLPPRRGQLGDEVGIHERHVAGEDDDLVAVAGQRSEGRADGVSRAARLHLQGEVGASAKTSRTSVVAGEMTTSGREAVDGSAAAST